MLLHLVGAEQFGSQGRIIGPGAVNKAVPAQPRHPLTHGGFHDLFAHHPYLWHARTSRAHVIL
jgi:hypothetical protein